MDDLKNHLGDLVAKKIDLQRVIDASPGTRPLEQVNQWLSRAEKIEAKAQILIGDYDQDSTINCFGRRCPKNCRTRFNLWMEIPPMDKEVTDHEQRLPQRVFEEAPIHSPQRLPIEETTGMESMIDEVWSHVQDETARMIGLHGMGGVGKTTLLTEVFNKLCSSTNMFDLQLYIVVSKTPNLVDIQNDIGKKIGLRDDDEWKSKSLDQKAIKIVDILEKKKYIMFLDDIWERFDLVKIGVPLPNSTNKSKVIFTTRLKQVCGQMKANKQVQVKCLNEDEAWALFKENVGEEALDAHPDIPGLAKEVMKECNGLPLALIVIGRAMTCKTTIHEWKHAIDALKENAARLSKDIHEKVYARLKYSYDNLSDDSIRSCFLYCSLYPEDAEISKEELIDKWLCEDFLVQSNDLDKDRRQGYANIGFLVKANLLEECPFEKVKMHDVIRDMAIWIGGDCGKNQDKFIVKARAGLTQMPNVANWEHTERLSLMDNNIDEPNAKCPNLMTLFLEKANLKSINNGFFEFMTKLRVLDLSWNSNLSSLPKDIGKMVCLQYLDVSFTDVVELPKELKELRKLKYLNLKRTPISSIPEGVVSSLKELRVFKFKYIFGYDHLYKEAESLKYLNDVGRPEITTKDGMSRLSSSIKLGNCITHLTFCDMDDLICLDLPILRNIKELYIGGVKTLEKIEVGRHGMILNSLRYLRIYNCDKLKDVSWLEFAPNIEEIHVSDCKEMKTMVGEPGRNDNTSPFEVGRHGMILNSLRRLVIESCDKLKDVSWLEFAPNIEEILVSCCTEMKTLVGEPGRNDNTRVVGGSPFAKLTKLQLVGLMNLESIYPTNLLLEKIEVGKHGMILNSLRCLDIRYCDKLKDVSWLEFAPNIEVIYVSDCKETKTLVGEPGRNDNTRVVGGSPFAKLTTLHLNSLRCLKLYYCEKLKDVSWLEFAPNIEEIVVYGCKEMKTLVGEPGRNDNTSPFAKLTAIQLDLLINLESIYPTNLLLPRLKSLRILNCNKLEKIPFQYVTGCDISIEGEKSWWDNLKWEDDATRISFSSHFKAIG